MDEGEASAPRSYSQLSQYGECPRRYQLSRIARVPRAPAWWLLGGRAFHATIEAYLRQSLEAK